MLEVRNLTRQFGAFRALDNVNFSVRGGEIVGLLGENGAGKSTLLKILGGELAPSDGEVLWDGAPLHLKSPREATRSGIGVVHQHFMLVPEFSVAENIALHAGRGVGFKPEFWAKQVEEWAASLAWKINGHARVAELSVGEQQRVEILKALFAGGEARLLLLDEPTANLTPAEVDELIAVVQRLREQGRGIVFVSHKLHEVMQLCDRVVVLRHGHVTGERAIQNTSTMELASLMVGRALDETSARTAPAAPAGSRQLRIENLSCGAIRNLSLTVRGEIVGLAGVDGNGQRELVEALSGLQKPDSGAFQVEDNGKAVDGILGFVPADRQSAGLVLPFDLAENIALHPAPRTQFRKPLGLDWPSIRRLTRDLMAKFDVRAAATGERTPAARLSGGNQQKVVVARALSFEPAAVVAADPTRGLDIGAGQFVHQQLRAAADSGTPVLLISTDLDEILRLSDRIGVLYEGRLLPDENLLPAGTSRDEIGRLMGGG